MDDHRLGPEFHEPAILECRDDGREVPADKGQQSSSLLMLPVATTGNLWGLPAGRWLSRKSRSLVTTTRRSASAISVIC